MTTTIASWNMHQRFDAWDRLARLVDDHGVSAAALQEAKPPQQIPVGWDVYPDAHQAEAWRISVPAETKRWYRSAMATCVPGIAWRPREPKPLAEATYGEFAASHPGPFAVLEGDVGGTRLTVISLYGLWDRMGDSGDLYVEATVHRAISDLTVLFQERGSEYVLVAGDLNIYSYSDGSRWGDRGMTAFQRLTSYGLEIVGPFRPDEEPRLADCPCPDPACRHVHTFLYQSNPKNRRHQLDFFLATPALKERLQRCWADPDPTWSTYSDHRPIFATFDLSDSPGE